MKKKITVTVPKLTSPGGVSSFWNALLPEFIKFEDLDLTVLEIGGHRKNALGPIIDQWNFSKFKNRDVDLVILNPSLGFRSFFRDVLFAKQLVKKKVPFVVFFHGWNLDFEKKVDVKYSRLFLGSLGKAEKIFVLSSDFKKKLQQWGYKGDIIIQTTTVNNNLLKDIEYNQDFKINEELSILFLSRLLKEKGVYETIAAFRGIKKNNPGIQLIIAGEGKEYSNLESLIRNDNDILMVGHVEGKEKIRLFKKCHVYCLPSYSEGLPTSVLEAMAFGIPVITTRVGGLNDFFKDGEMGYLVEPKNVKQLEYKLSALISNKDLLVKIGEFNYQYAHNNIISPIVAKRFYKQILEVLS